MRPLRWKTRYLTGDQETDLRHRELVDCLNKLVQAVRQQEHCQEVEDMLEDLSRLTDRQLLDRRRGAAIAECLRAELRDRLPLPAYDTNACRKCGVCDLAARKVTEPLRETALCLHLEETSQRKEPSASA